MWEIYEEEEEDEYKEPRDFIKCLNNNAFHYKILIMHLIPGDIDLFFVKFLI